MRVVILRRPGVLGPTPLERVPDRGSFLASVFTAVGKVAISLDMDDRYSKQLAYQIIYAAEIKVIKTQASLQCSPKWPSPIGLEEEGKRGFVAGKEAETKRSKM